MTKYMIDILILRTWFSIWLHICKYIKMLHNMHIIICFFCMYIYIYILISICIYIFIFVYINIFGVRHLKFDLDIQNYGTLICEWSGFSKSPVLVSMLNFQGVQFGCSHVPQYQSNDTIFISMVWAPQKNLQFPLGIAAKRLHATYTDTASLNCNHSGTEEHTPLKTHISPEK